MKLKRGKLAFSSIKILTSVLLTLFCSSLVYAKKSELAIATEYKVIPLLPSVNNAEFHHPFYSHSQLSLHHRSAVRSGLTGRAGPLTKDGCEFGGWYFPDYENCGAYKMCEVIDGKWVVHNFQCPEGQSFFEDLQSCGDVPCEQRDPWPEVPPHLPCPESWKKITYPGKCRKYYVCVWTGSYYTWYENECDPEKGFFYERTQTCHQLSRYCPLEDVEKPENWPCAKKGQYDHHVNPDDCSKYYECHKCYHPTKPGAVTRCVKNFECPPGQIFDGNGNETKPGCITGKCPIKDIKLPLGWKCDGEGKLHVHPDKCKKYYKCIKCQDPIGGEYCYENIQMCPAPQYFDDFKKECVPTKKCPQGLIELPEGDGWSCEKDGEMHVHPKDCSQFYTCISCGKGNGWCYEAVKCPDGKLFDDFQKKCVHSKICPQEWVELPVGHGWNCEFEEELNVHPEDCGQYYKCFMCDRPRKWCYVQNKCPDAHTFDDELMHCVVSRCPQHPAVLPPNWKCETKNELKVDPVDCTQYYTCVVCPDADQNPWCYVPGSCPDGHWFDDIQKLCVVHDTCPQQDKELPEGWTCEMEGDAHVVPTDCRQFYECYRCSKPKGWCVDESMCVVGHTFDNTTKICVEGTCPQDKPELPEGPGWHCRLEGDANVFPGNCSKYYMCETCSKPIGWCYTEHNCPEGHTFYDGGKECVLGKCPQDPYPIPPDFNCTNNGDIHVNPTDCSKYYTCIWTGSYFTWIDLQCPEGENFDENTNFCVEGACPQLLTEIGDPPEWQQCAEEGEINVFPGNCSKYFTCLACSKPKKWCYYLPESCPPGHNFDQTLKACVEGSCPQDRPEIKEDWTCADENEEHVLPEDCKKYYTCQICDKPKKWCYEEHACPSGETYDNTLKICVPGRCPQLPPLIPVGWNCTDEGEVHVVPEDCTSFYTCIKCENGPWCYNNIEICPDGQTFDDTKKKCVHGRCPQYPPILPPTWLCKNHGENHVNPSNCSSYYSCMECPDVSEWCYSQQSCEPENTYDDINKRCVPGRCPHYPSKLPDGWNCSTRDELNVDPTDCTQYYQCVKDNCPDSEWCHIKYVCPSGHNFDDAKKECIEGTCPQNLPELPNEPGFNCSNEVEMHVYPSDCSSFYICHQCSKPSGWCYEKKNCPSGETFHDGMARCIPARCPQWPDKVPPDWVCNEEGELWPYPDDCMDYYKCIKCPDGGWCYELFRCPKDTNFNLNKKKCVEGPCSNKPTEPPPPPQSYQCSRWDHVGRRYVDKLYCDCYWVCKWFVIFFAVKRHCCWYGKHFNKETGWCEWGSCYNGKPPQIGKPSKPKATTWTWNFY